MKDPVFCQDGYSYERKAIVQWLSRTNKSPITNAHLSNTALISNYNLKRQLLFRFGPGSPEIALFNLLPTEILVHIASFLDVRSLCRSSLVCIFWSQALETKSLWTSKLRSLPTEISEEDHLRLERNELTPKQLYRKKILEHHNLSQLLAKKMQPSLSGIKLYVNK